MSWCDLTAGQCMKCSSTVCMWCNNELTVARSLSDYFKQMLLTHDSPWPNLQPTPLLMHCAQSLAISSWQTHCEQEKYIVIMANTYAWAASMFRMSMPKTKTWFKPCLHVITHNTSCMSWHRAHDACHNTEHIMHVISQNTKCMKTMIDSPHQSCLSVWHLCMMAHLRVDNWSLQPCRGTYLCWGTAPVQSWPGLWRTHLHDISGTSGAYEKLHQANETQATVYGRIMQVALKAGQSCDHFPTPQKPLLCLFTRLQA